MRIRVSLLAAGLVGLGFLPTPALQAGPLKDPKRVIDQRMVDLTPLFHYWTNHAGARPLSAWVHLTGSIVARNAFGWTVQAKVEGASVGSKKAAGEEGRILLKNPPAHDLARFEQLTAQLKTLDHEHQELAGEAATADSRSRQIQALNRNRVRSRALSVEATQMRQTEAQAKIQLKAVDQQRKDCQTKLAAYGGSTNYVVDCFALDSKQEYSGQHVYDYGLVPR